MEEKSVDTTNVFVKFLPASVDDMALLKMFSPFGRIVSYKVMIDPGTLKSLGYGFVKFSTQEEALLAIENMAGCRMQNKTLLCKLSDRSPISLPCPNLYIRPLPPNFTEGELKDIFSKFGNIGAVKIVKDPKKPKDAIGLVRYGDVNVAQNALLRANGSPLIAGWSPLIVKFAESDQQRAFRKATITPPRKNSVAQKDVFTPNYAYEQPCEYFQAPVYAYPVQFVYYPVLMDDAQDTPVGWYNPYTNVTYPGYFRE